MCWENVAILEESCMASADAMAQVSESWPMGLLFWKGMFVQTKKYIGKQCKSRLDDLLRGLSSRSGCKR